MTQPRVSRCGSSLVNPLPNVGSTRIKSMAMTSFSRSASSTVSTLTSEPSTLAQDKLEHGHKRPKGPNKTKPKNHQRPPLPAIDENDIEEDFIRGRGPGGQVINRRSMLVQLLHKPTGTRIRCQETRSREQNRKIARKWLSLKLDLLWNGSKSKQMIQWNKEKSKKLSKKRKQKRRLNDNDDDEEEEKKLDLNQAEQADESDEMGSKQIKCQAVGVS
ncbi:hypothetical protein OIO90_004084 [Microbotryomycetes sp. JL221]|nr:hypothetical protein OIO90_004084 [Microbotryomycetes sp. JL221]